MMIGAPLVMESASWALWFWQHRHEFAPVLQKLAEGTHWMETFLADPLGAVRRVGNLLVFGGVGQGTILAFLDPFSNQAEAASASTGESSVPLTLASLQGASTVALGLAALTPLALTTQFVVLSRRLAELQKQIAELSRKFDVDKSTKLKAGLDLLESGTQLSHKDRSAGRDRLNRALERCVDSMHYYSALLGNELANPTINRAAVRLEARHLALAIVGVASCHVSLGDDEQAFVRSETDLEQLREAARRVFRDTVARDPGPFLLPPMKAHGMTIDSMVELFRRARDAGLLDSALNGSTGSWFEEYRECLVNASRKVPFVFMGTNDTFYRELGSQMQDAALAVEEVSRVDGMLRLVREVRAAGLSMAAVKAELGQLRRKLRSETAQKPQHIVWSLS